MSESFEGTSFEDALKELEAIASKLEGGNIPLEMAISSYERAVALQKHCSVILEKAKMRIKSIAVDKEGAISTSSFEA